MRECLEEAIRARISSCSTGSTPCQIHCKRRKLRYQAWDDCSRRVSNSSKLLGIYWVSEDVSLACL
ncbi:Uncharacterised protein [Vibrio cholerae]|nr:Uncharacterised protein [Vibrio cholerae]CSI56685.1 Uncharacterised protein [Vibrio cholerae]